MAPETEYMINDTSYTNKVDVYALGLMYLKLLTKKNPFVCKSVNEYNKHLA